MKYIFHFVKLQKFNRNRKLNRNISIVNDCLCLFFPAFLSNWKWNYVMNSSMNVYSTNNLKLPESTWISMRLRFTIYCGKNAICKEWDRGEEKERNATRIDISKLQCLTFWRDREELLYNPKMNWNEMTLICILNKLR